MTSGTSDSAAYMRGRLHISGVDADTPLGTALDVIMTLVVDHPRDALQEWRKKFDVAMWKIRPPDRESWGMRPDQQDSMRRLAGGVAPKVAQPQPGRRAGVAESRQSRPRRPGPHR